MPKEEATYVEFPKPLPVCSGFNAIGVLNRHGPLVLVKFSADSKAEHARFDMGKQIFIDEPFQQVSPANRRKLSSAISTVQTPP